VAGARIGSFSGATAHPFGVGVSLDALYNSNSADGGVVTTPGPPPAPSVAPPPTTVPKVTPPPVKMPPSPFGSGVNGIITSIAGSPLWQSPEAKAIGSQLGVIGTTLSNTFGISAAPTGKGTAPKPGAFDFRSFVSKLGF
jgi:hypothetical protein